MARRRHEKAAQEPATVADEPTPQPTPPQPLAHSQARAREAVIAEVCEHLRAGLPKKLACDLTGVPRRTLYNWLQDEGVATQVNQALAEGARRHLELIDADIAHGGERDRSRAANVRLHYVKTLYPDYTAPEQLQVTVRQEDELTDDQILEEAARIYERKQVEAKLLPAVDAEEEAE